MASSHAKLSRERVRAHRARLRRQGMRPIQVWVPNVRSTAFKRQAHRQSLAVGRSAYARADQEFIDSVSDWGDE